MGAMVDNYGQEHGACAVGVIRIESNVADGETVTIGSNVFEFDNNAAVVSGNIAVDVSGGLTPTNATTQLEAKINAENDHGLRAKRIDANEIVLFSRGPSDVSVAMAETMGGANNAVDAAVNDGKYANRRAG